MTREEFVSLIGKKNIVVDYPFFEELQQWSMGGFYIKDGQIYHKRHSFNMDSFIRNARNPHVGEPTHG